MPQPNVKVKSMEVAGSTPVQQANAITDPAGRWERLIPITVPIFAVALFGVLLLPAHANLQVYLHLWMLATLTLFLFISFRVRKLRNPGGAQVSKPRTLSGDHIASYQLDGPPVPRKGSLISDFFLGAGSAMAVFAEGQMLIIAISPYFSTSPSTSATIKTAAISLTMTVLSLSIYSAMLLTRGRRPERVISGRPAFYLSLGILLSLFVPVTFLIFQVPMYIFVGPPAPWPTLFAYAQDQAERMDKDAVLWEVSARPPFEAPGPYSPENTPLEVSFAFYAPDAESIGLKVLDVDPPRLLSIEHGSQYAGSPIPNDMLRKQKECLASVRLGPREVYSLTGSEGLDFGKEKGSTVSPYLSLNLYCDKRYSFGETAGWYISYLADQSADISSLRLSVDGATGKVVGRERWPEDLEKPATPIPVASPTVRP
ncbi:MAG TPA: hypothetical protein VJ183_10885 [Chloroflexia bacterium]|nr:hypothetical protein [Chloroflexia bacterium]